MRKKSDFWHKPQRQKKIICLVGARPNLVKIAPIIKAFQASGIKPLLVHSGQHYDYQMSQVFFKDLDIPKPDIHLGVGSGDHGEQTGKILIEMEKVLLKYRPDVLIVVGDVNTTLAGALAAAKLNIPVAHVEAGLRSHDRTMPEEINRILTDQIADYLFIHSPEARQHLLSEGVKEKKIYNVGNVMIDTLLSYKDMAAKKTIIDDLKIEPQKYGLLTLHRPSNVDDFRVFAGILAAIGEIQKQLPIVFPIHPRTKNQLKKRGIKGRIKPMKQMIFIDPQGYLDFLHLTMNAKLVLTDSGGIQEETTILKVPCLTLRKVTERPITIKKGTNQLVGIKTADIIKGAKKVLNGLFKPKGRPAKWDGKASQRIAEIIIRDLGRD